MTDEVRYERVGAAAVLTIDRPERRNAIDGATAHALHEGFRAFVDDDGARALIVTGAGDEAFCAGADLKALETLEGDAPAARSASPASPRPSRRSRPSPAGAWPAASSSHCGATCGSPRRAPGSASPSGASACR